MTIVSMDAGGSEQPDRITAPKRAIAANLIIFILQSYLKFYALIVLV